MELQKPVIFIEELINNKKRYSLLAFRNDYTINSTEDLCNLCSEENENKEYIRYESKQATDMCKRHLENVKEMNHDRIKRMCILVFTCPENIISFKPYDHKKNIMGNDRNEGGLNTIYDFEP